MRLPHRASARTFKVILLPALCPTTKAPMNGWPSGPFSLPVILAASPGDARQTIIANTTLSNERIIASYWNVSGREYQFARAPCDSQADVHWAALSGEPHALGVIPDA